MVASTINVSVCAKCSDRHCPLFPFHPSIIIHEYFSLSDSKGWKHKCHRHNSMQIGVCALRLCCQQRYLIFWVPLWRHRIYFSSVCCRTLSQEINENVSRLFCCCECKFVQRSSSYEPLSSNIALEPANNSPAHNVSSSEQVSDSGI